MTVGRGFVDLVLAGELDLRAVDRMGRLLPRLERLDARLLVHLRQVGFADSAGLEPLIDTARRRSAQPGHDVLIRDTSPPVRRLLQLVGSTGTVLDPGAWDTFFADPYRPTTSLAHPVPIAGQRQT